ncbi:MAG: hypothetical protein ACREJC_08295 [Tepidisphaeraceae bacterium]
MNRKNPLHAMGTNMVIVSAALVGGGNNANMTVPANTVQRKETNAAVSGTRTAEGVYNVVLNSDLMPPRVVAIVPLVEGAGHKAEVTTAYVLATKTVVITTRNAATTADDLPTTDTLKLLIYGQDSSSG